MIVSGGQTGVDRGALAAARAAGARIGGWVPAGRAAEDGPISEDFVGLRETASADPAERTALNVRDSDGTLILAFGPLAGGSALTRQVAETLGRPMLHLDLDRVDQRVAVEAATSWIRAQGIEVLNVAGPRASEDVRAFDASFAIVSAILARAH